MSRLKICYVAGFGRSGSTLLGELLGQIEGFSSVGEIRQYFMQRERPGWRCGCDMPLVECPFWSQVAKRGHPPIDSITADRVVSLWRQSFRTRHVPKLAWEWMVRHREPAPEYAAMLLSLYSAIAEVSGADVVVDTSKRPADALITASIPEVELFLVHLVRDPRAVAFSWSRTRPSPGGIPGGQPLGKRTTAQSSAQWLYNNASFSTLLRRLAGPKHYLRIRYEDFVAEPRATLEAIGMLLGQPIGDLPFLDGRTVRLRSTHTVAGNPARFRTGPIELSMDDEWRRAMSPRQRWLATAVASPLMPSMGYRIDR